MSTVMEHIITYYRDFPTWEAIASTPQSALAAASPGAGPKTDTQPVNEPGLAKNGGRAASWGDLYFGWVHLVPDALDFGFLLARREDTILICNADLTGERTLLSVDPVNAAGMLLSAGAMPLSIEPLKDVAAVLVTEMAGPPGIDARFDLVFDSGQVPKLSCTGTRSIPFPFMPQAGLKEVLAWLTDVNEAYDGPETREQVRIAPRQSFHGKYSEEGNQARTTLKAIVTGWQMRYFGYPVWTEATRVGAITSGQQWIAFDTANASYKAGGYCYIAGGRWDEGELRAILDIQPDGITLMLPVENSYPRPAVMPVRIARMDGTPKYEENAFFTEADIGFAVEDNDPVEAGASAVQYLGFDTLLTPYGAPGQRASRQIIRPAEVIDGETGKVLVDPRGDWGRLAFEEAHFKSQTKAEAWDFRKWLHRRAGRMRPVWVPTFERDIEIIEPFAAADTILVIGRIRYTQMLFVNPQFRHVALFRTNGEVLLRRIVNAQEVTGGEWITLDAALGFDGTGADFDRVSFMPLCRLAADRVEIEWQRVGCCKSAVGLTGLDADHES